MVSEDREHGRAVDGAAEGYERTDARFWPLVLSGVALIVVMALGMVVSRRVVNLFEKGGEELPQHPMSAFRQGPAGPLLQADPYEELENHEAWEQRALNEYAWIDPVGGGVRLPVERAAELALEEGFPVRNEAAPSSADLGGER